MARKAQKVFVVLSGSVRSMIDDMARVKKADPTAEVISFSAAPACCIMEARKNGLPKDLTISDWFAEA